MIRDIGIKIYYSFHVRDTFVLNSHISAINKHNELLKRFKYTGSDSKLY